MAEMTIRLRRDAVTGKKDIVVTLHSDADALPHEHEQMHRALVDKLIHGGLLQASEAGGLIVEREEKEQPPTNPTEVGSQEQRQPQKRGH
jgi:hypothetical protein